MKALAEWKSFSTACYPDGMTSEQEKQLRRAFFAGALVAFQNVEAATFAADERAAVRDLEKMRQEVIGECAIHAKSCEMRN